jgi:predicted O-methyltransferase YrrM
MNSFGKSILHTLRYMCGLDHAHTQTTSAERHCLARLAQGRRRIVEIGVYEGASTRILADHMAPDGTLYGVDPFIPGRLGICWGRMIARREARKGAAGRRVQFIERFSHDAAREITGNFDLVFIDGDHSLEGITRDWTDWAARIEPGSLIALHDTRVPAHNPNVAGLGSCQYFESHIRHDPRFELLEQVDSLSVLRRKSA